MLLQFLGLAGAIALILLANSAEKKRVGAPPVDLRAVGTGAVRAA